MGAVGNEFVWAFDKVQKYCATLRRFIPLRIVGADRRKRICSGACIYKSYSIATKFWSQCVAPPRWPSKWGAERH